MVHIKKAKMLELDIIIDILNKVTLNLHEKNINQWDYPWNRDEIKSDIEKGRVYVLLSDINIVATFSIQDIDNINDFVVEKNSKYLYRIAILTEYQGKKFGERIIDYVCEYSRELQKSVYLDCWAGNEKLRSFYSNAGFSHMGDFKEEDYFVSIFKK